MAATLPLSLWLSGTGAGSNPSAWVLPGASFDVDLVNNRGYTTTGGTVLPSTLLTTVRSSTKFVTNSAGVLVPFAANALPRTNLGGLPEQAATNTLLWSQVFQNAAWVSLDGGTITGNATVAPDLTTTAASLVGTTRVRQLTGVVTVPSTWTYSVWIKGITATSVTIRLTNDFNSEGADVVCTVTPGVWTRYQVTFTYTATSSGRKYDVRFSANNGSFYAWGAQLELSAFPTSYIPTTTAAVTRAADSVSATLGSWFNAAQGTLLVKATPASVPFPANTNEFQIATIDDGTTNNRIAMWADSANSKARSVVVSGGVTQWLSGLAGGTLSSDVAFKAAFSYAAANFSYTTNGVAAASQASGSLPVSPNKLWVGNREGTAQFNNYIQRITYWPSIKNVATVSALP